MPYLSSTNSNQIATNFPLLKIYKSESSKELAPAFRVKLAQKKRQYPELDLFKRRLEDEDQDAHPHLFSDAKEKLFAYRLIFLGLAFLFFFFAGLFHSLSFNWSYSFLFESWFTAKWALSCLMVVVGFTASALAIFPCSLREATRSAAEKARKSLEHFYQKQKIRYGICQLSFWGENHRRNKTLKNSYHEVLHKVQDKEEAVYHLLKKISKTASINKTTKERLYNQALAELHDQLRTVVRAFENTELSY